MSERIDIAYRHGIEDATAELRDTITAWILNRQRDQALVLADPETFVADLLALLARAVQDLTSF